jgi:hypothetical protein
MDWICTKRDGGGEAPSGAASVVAGGWLRVREELRELRVGLIIVVF